MVEEDSSLDDLADQHGEATVRKALWLQEEIYKHGLDAVRFTDAAEASMQKTGPLLVKKGIEDEFVTSV